MKKFAAAAILCIAPAVASAAVVDLDSKLNTNAIGQGVSLSLDAGTYSVTPFDNSANPGGFIAWNAWGADVVAGCDSDGASCAKGFLTNYAFRIGSDVGTVFPSGAFETKAKAVQNGVAATFTLAGAQTVEFYINDSNYGDNVGGVSLQVSQVPVPPAMGLLAAGLAALGVVRRRRA